MVHLISKDFKIQSRSVIQTLVSMIVISCLYLYLGLSIEATFTVCCLLGVNSMVFGSIGYDEMNQSDLLLLSLPVKRKNIVMAKYVVALLFLLLSLLVATFITAISYTVFKQSSHISPTVIMYSITMLILMLSILLPVYYLFGYKNIRYVNSAFIILVVLSFFLHMQSNVFQPVLTLIQATSAPVLLLIEISLCLIAYLASMAFSFRIMEKREF
ncbi:ABC-2 transporter permease [Bacillus sp. 1P06AnD]|uniref:ABC-2 transporter permease n=1 Tax=Bacillus sp. 1P06AnD TaxID=3132208 RepID=UPI0039A05D37